MPGYDGTGPMGQGPLTGRGLGHCRSGRRIGFGRWGFGRGIRSGYGPRYGYTEPAPLTKEEQRRILEEELRQIDLEKKEMEQRLKEMQ